MEVFSVGGQLHDVRNARAMRFYRSAVMTRNRRRDLASAPKWSCVRSKTPGRPVRFELRRTADRPTGTFGVRNELSLMIKVKRSELLRLPLSARFPRAILVIERECFFQAARATGDSTSFWRDEAKLAAFCDSWV